MRKTEKGSLEKKLRQVSLRRRSERERERGIRMKRGRGPIKKRQKIVARSLLPITLIEMKRLYANHLVKHSFADTFFYAFHELQILSVLVALVFLFNRIDLLSMANLELEPAAHRNIFLNERV